MADRIGPFLLLGGGAAALWFFGRARPAAAARSMPSTRAASPVPFPLGKGIAGSLQTGGNILSGVARVVQQVARFFAPDPKTAVTVINPETGEAVTSTSFPDVLRGSLFDSFNPLPGVPEGDIFGTGLQGAEEAFPGASTIEFAQPVFSEAGIDVGLIGAEESFPGASVLL